MWLVDCKVTPVRLWGNKWGHDGKGIIFNKLQERIRPLAIRPPVASSLQAAIADPENNYGKVEFNVN